MFLIIMHTKSFQQEVSFTYSRLILFYCLKLDKWDFGVIYHIY